MPKTVHKAVDQLISAWCVHINGSTMLDLRSFDRGTIHINCFHDNAIWIPNVVCIKLAAVIIHVNQRMIFQHRYRSTRALLMPKDILKTVDQFIVTSFSDIYCSANLDFGIFDRVAINVNCCYDNAIWIPNTVCIEFATVIIDVNRRMIF